ncbi:MAG TPA: efflux RND transporter periplasmic adaptor subunit [Puia sp.]|nr:efflux RND transporter periplasmic adaptor subunit [Puia sp.]
MKYKNSFFAIPFLLLLYSCKSGSGNENSLSASDPDSIRVPVTVMAMTHSFGNSGLSFSGSTEAKTTVSFGFMVGGKVSHVMVDEGSKVSKGQLIADLETTDYMLTLDIANANLQKVQDEYDRLTILKDRGSLPAGDYVKAVANLNETMARQKQAIKSVSDSRLYSPIPGIVSKKNTNPGEVISPGMSLFSIVDIDPMRVVVAVPESEIGQVRAGQPVKVEIPALDSSFSGIVRLIGPVADPNTRSYSIKIDLPNPHFLIRGGMIATATLPSIHKASGLLLPADAVLHDIDQTTYVFIADPGKNTAFKRKILVGALYDNKIEVSSGLNENELVVVGGQQKIQDGSLIQIKTARP